ncbi:kunitz-type protease inhibitor 1 isoform X2 [Zalophus californianus]|uniref:Kunitz-type protease inhibitor 1 isoform X2 n=1 Tax=Zalophus californianus TaxID=9704 RepID=A0A6J2BE79_ZALCA|nr:kunitz-type protease inhibitor 1 isoform X2 [Zalophus californianus]
MMACARLSQAHVPAVAVWLLCALDLLGTEAGPPPAPPGLPPGGPCLDRFTAGVPAFVLDTEASVSNGATFLGSPTVRRGWDCVRACCTTENCNLALVELKPDGGEDAIAACFLMNCLYEQNFVCKFAPREGFINYLKREVYHSYRELRTQGFGGSRIPKVWTGIDLKVQPQEPLVLKNVENTDWYLLQGDADVRVEKNEPDQVKLWGLKEGTYLFQLTAADSNQPESMTNVTVTVLSPKQTEEYCLASSKVGRCRGSFPRWYYDPKEQICKSFVYGGCLGNKNNYLREEECKLACRDVQGPSLDRHGPASWSVMTRLTAPMPPMRPSVRNTPVASRSSRTSTSAVTKLDVVARQGSDPEPSLLKDRPSSAGEKTETLTQSEKLKENWKKKKKKSYVSQGHCVDLPDTGICLENIPRWYYNPFSERCARFTYGGCHGNKNNFEEEQQCLASCRGISSSVEVSIAVLLVTCIVVVIALLGYCFFKNQRKGFHRHRHGCRHHHNHHLQPPTPASSTVSTTEDTEHLVYNHTTRPL